MAWNPTIRETVALDVIRQILYLTHERPPAVEVVDYAYEVADHFIRKSESFAGRAAHKNHEEHHSRK